MERGYKFNEIFIAGQDIFLEDIEAEANPAILRIHITVDQPSKLFVTRKQKKDMITENLNSGHPLLPNCAYIFDIMTRQKHSINFQIGSTTKVLYMQVIEIPIVGGSQG